ALLPHPSSSLFPYTTLFRSLHRLLRRVGLAADVVEALVVALDDAHEDDGRLGLAEGLEDLMREREELPGADALGALQQLADRARSEEHTSELQSRFDLVCRL